MRIRILWIKYGQKHGNIYEKSSFLITDPLPGQKPCFNFLYSPITKTVITVTDSSMGISELSSSIYLRASTPYARGLR
ncbi:hypothetical protein [Methanolobus psychrotolerans]|uniref:hypothetical protein n=1 Tax=Methanolobus psychrotolerans TaxID=1874706 RepID=UPI00101AD6E5|nr:hypothetical protein [Methanolobus psychrotolerans]